MVASNILGDVAGDGQRLILGPYVGLAVNTGYRLKKPRP
jgi:hypothetical protein